MARESYTSFTLRGPIPHTGVVSDIHRQPYTMKLKNKFSFGPPQDRPRLHLPFFLQFWTPEHQRTAWTNITPTDIQPIPRKPTYLSVNLN